MDRWAGTQLMRPSLTNSETSIEIFSAIFVQSLASGLDADVAAAVPALAAHRIDMQSVFIFGGNAFTPITKSIAHSSAAAALAIHEGGLPKP